MPKVLIGIPTGRQPGSVGFYDYLDALELPEGTIKSAVHGQSPARARNIIIEQALAMNCTHVLFLDDDVAIKPNLLKQLLSHDIDVVTGLYKMRNYPHRPIAFSQVDQSGTGKHLYLTDGITGLVQISACGLGCILIKTDVFKQIQKYKLAGLTGKMWVTLGEIEADQWYDDISFFKRVRTAGFKIYCDTSCLVGHIASVVIWPNYINGKWMTTYDTAGTDQVSVPEDRVTEFTYAGAN